MVLIVCIDDKGGMMFNNRRQSKDRLLRERILSLTENSKLWMNEYSAKQFEEYSPQIVIDGDFLDKAGEKDYCFVENIRLASCTEKAHSVILYKWNRVYPSDAFFDMPLDGYKLAQSTFFPGSSHEKITEEVYVK